MRTRVLRRKHENGTIITVTIKRKTVIVEGTRNGRDTSTIKLKRERGWRERFKAIVDNKAKENENHVQAWIPSAASC